MKIMKRLIAYGTLALTLVFVAMPVPFTDARSKSATPTAAELRALYSGAAQGGEKVRILVVPGHEPGNGGAEYQGIYERELTVDIADQLASYLGKNPRIEVIVARSDTGWNEDLSGYFEEEWKDIERFVEDRKETMRKMMKRGKITERTSENQVPHAAAPSGVALRLYGINKWANENDVDLVVHLHANDALDHGPDTPGANSGFAVYVPDPQYGNASTSRAVAEAIEPRLSAMSATSTLPVENRGIVPDQELIALGAFNTLAVPSVLIEYAYITEPRFTHPEVRDTVLQDFAYETYLGIQDFFKDPVVMRFGTASLPFTFAESSLPETGSSSPETYALQAALHSIDLYPTYATTTPENARIALPTLTACPIDGVMGPCTVNAIEQFQISNGWQTTGTLGPKTVAALNARFAPAPLASSGNAQTRCTALVHELSKGTADADTGGEVSRLQSILAQDPAVYPEGLVTGYYGEATQRAVERFQEKHEIAQEGAAGFGLIGPKTRAALASACQ